MALEERATRLLALPEGNYTPSTSPALLDVLTDENIVVAVAAVEAVAARQPAPPSANALKKLLATVVADARGAIKMLDKTAALTVGKRLHRQAERVRDILATARSAAAADRSRVRATAAADPAARATIRADLAAIDAAEHRALEAPQQEVYIGFSELEELLPLPGDAAEGAAARIERACAAAEAARAAEVAAHAATRYERTVAKLPDMPPALTCALGPDGVQALWECAAEGGFEMRTSSDWCSALNTDGNEAPLASLVRKLVCERRVRCIEDLDERLVDTCTSAIEERDALICAVRDHRDALHELVEAKDGEGCGGLRAPRSFGEGQGARGCAADGHRSLDGRADGTWGGGAVEGGRIGDMCMYPLIGGVTFSHVTVMVTAMGTPGDYLML
jgi:hypothetical protein